MGTKHIEKKKLFTLKEKDVGSHGHTKDCPGCRTTLQGVGHRTGTYIGVQRKVPTFEKRT